LLSRGAGLRKLCPRNGNPVRCGYVRYHPHQVAHATEAFLSPPGSSSTDLYIVMKAMPTNLKVRRLSPARMTLLVARQH
jgi:hypothetical protein